MFARPIKDSTWKELLRLSVHAVDRGWANPGVFATAVGPKYTPGSERSILYVGKSGGPLNDSLSLGDDQEASAAATGKWMIDRMNPSPFWVFADLLSGRESLAWSNLAKIDARGSAPPKGDLWRSTRDVCLQALAEEMEHLQPGRAVFATSGYNPSAIESVLRRLGYEGPQPYAGLDRTTVFTDPSNRLAVITRHPQGWSCENRDPVARFIREWPHSQRSVA